MPANFSKFRPGYLEIIAVRLKSYSAIAVVKVRHCVGIAFPPAPTITQSVMKLIAKIWRKTFPDAKTVNKMIEYSVKKWFNRDFPEIVQTYIYSG